MDPKNFISFKLGAPCRNGHQAQSYANLISHFGLIFLQQGRACKNEVQWIMFCIYQSKSTDIHLN